jgi:hypothetical protein
MASKFDESEFIDSDYESSRQSVAFGSGTLATAPAMSSNPQPNPSHRPPTREEIEAKVSDTHSKLADLKRAQEQLERERASLEEARRRRIEFHIGREEMLNHLARGVEILKEGEFNARRDAEQMSKSLMDLQEALAKVESLKEETWTQENWNMELTRALTTLENARMEWNSSRLKWPVLDGALKAPEPENEDKTGITSFLKGKSFWEICQIGLVLTWPLVLAALTGVIAISVILLMR